MHTSEPLASVGDIVGIVLLGGLLFLMVVVVCAVILAILQRVLPGGGEPADAEELLDDPSPGPGASAGLDVTESPSADRADLEPGTRSDAGSDRISA